MGDFLPRGASTIALAFLMRQSNTDAVINEKRKVHVIVVLVIVVLVLILVLILVVVVVYVEVYMCTNICVTSCVQKYFDI